MTHKLFGFWIDWFHTGLHLREAGRWPGKCLWKKDPRGPVFIPTCPCDYRRGKTRGNLKHIMPFLNDGFQWWWLKNEIPVGNELWFCTCILSVTYVMIDSSFLRFLLEVYKIRQGLGCRPFFKNPIFSLCLFFFIINFRCTRLSNT